MIKEHLCSIFHPSIPHGIYSSTLHTSMRPFWYDRLPSASSRGQCGAPTSQLRQIWRLSRKLFDFNLIFVCHSGMDSKHHIDTCNVVPSRRDAPQNFIVFFDFCDNVDYRLSTALRFSAVLLCFGTHLQTLWQHTEIHTKWMQGIHKQLHPYQYAYA